MYLNIASMINSFMSTLVHHGKRWVQKKRQGNGLPTMLLLRHLRPCHGPKAAAEDIPYCWLIGRCKLSLYLAATISCILVLHDLPPSKVWISPRCIIGIESFGKRIVLCLSGTTSIIHHIHALRCR